MPTQLLDGRYVPITSEIGFLECDEKTAAKAFREWQRPIHSGRGVQLQTREIAGDLSTKLDSLLPLTSIEARRFIFLPTTSSWTAFVDNGWRGTDVFSVVSYLAMAIGCRGIRAVSIPHTIAKTGSAVTGRSGATMLEVYAADVAGCSFLNIRRSLSVSHDGQRWRFDASGAPLEFEQPEHYQAMQIRDRFTPDLLEEYLGHLRIRRLSPEFYDNSQNALLVEKTGPRLPGSKEYTLAEAGRAL